MIIKNSTSLLITLSIVLILPFVQKQWFNLYLFNINNISFYSTLYYLSGTICPLLICLNSLNYFTYYKFNNNIIKSKKIIKGKTLLFLVVINLFFLSYLIINYLYINLDLITNLFLKSFKLQQPDIFQFLFLMIFIGILLIFRKSRIFFKKLILVNFILISFFNWYLQINNIIIDNKFHIYKYYELDNNNFINIIFLIAIEITFFTWSFLSYKTNLSDWIVPIPHKSDLLPILKILIFYFFIIFYYSSLT